MYNCLLELIYIYFVGFVDLVFIKKGFKYCLVFIDDIISVVFVKFLRNNSDILVVIKRFFVDLVFYDKVKSMRFDNGGEFIFVNFKVFFRGNYIRYDIFVFYLLYLNGIVEWYCKILFEKGRCLFIYRLV